MKLLWFTWKDCKNPLSGGAEIVNEQLAKRLVAAGHEVTFLVAGFPQGKSEEVIDGYKIIRLGNKWSVYYRAYKYYNKNLLGWADLVIDEMNTIPFFCKFFVRERNIMFVHQLCRQIWFYQFPWLFAWLGYLSELIYLRLLNDSEVMTVSQSTKNDLVRFGFKPENIEIITEGIEIEPVNELSDLIKYSNPTILSLGSIRPMKRTDHIVKAFEIAKLTIPNLQLIVAGDADCPFGQKVLKLIASSRFCDSIQYLGKVNRDKKIELLQKAHILCATSIKEGWGLVATEANSQGTPAVVYNVDGLRDSVKDGLSGVICAHKTPLNLAQNIISILCNNKKYELLRKYAWQLSKEINFKNSYQDLLSIIQYDK